jgi:Pyridoxamine 5'-phosphate oxidase
MSVSLNMNNLRAECARFGTTPYLLTQSDDGRPHAVAVSIEWHGDFILTSAGTHSTSNVTARPLLSLLWPPFEAGGCSLIVDGDGHVNGSDARISVKPTRGVLHRPGSSPAYAARGCGSDCIPLAG